MGEDNRRNNGKIQPIDSSRYRKVSQEARKLKGNNTEKNKTQKERKKLRKSRRRNVIIGLAAYGIAAFFAGSKVNNLLNPPVEGVTQNENGTVVDVDVNQHVEFKGNDRKEFLARLAQETIDDKLESNTEQEINNLQTPEAVLDYIKEIYVSEFNKENEEKISIEDVVFGKNMYDIVIYEDKAQNGDEILRYCTESYAERNGIRLDGDKCVLTATTTYGSEKVAWNSKGEAQTVYHYTEDVPENKETVLAGVSEEILAGINYATSIEQGDNNHWEVHWEYKQRLIDAVKEHKGELIDEIVTGENQQDSDGIEPGD